MQLASRRPPVWLRVEGNGVDDSAICVFWLHIKRPWPLAKSKLSAVARGSWHHDLTYLCLCPSKKLCMHLFPKWLPCWSPPEGLVTTGRAVLAASLRAPERQNGTVESSAHRWMTCEVRSLPPSSHMNSDKMELEVPLSFSVFPWEIPTATSSVWFIFVDMFCSWDFRWVIKQARLFVVYELC